MTSALPYFTTPLAHLITALNQNLVKVESSKIVTAIERQVLASLHKMLYEQDDSFYTQHTQASASTLGILGTGGTIANLTALWCARNAFFRPTDSFAGIEQAGLPQALLKAGYKGVAIIGSELMHYSFDKGADLLGLGIDNLIKIPVDANHRIQVDLLKRRNRSVQAKQHCNPRDCRNRGNNRFRRD